MPAMRKQCDKQKMAVATRKREKAAEAKIQTEAMEAREEAHRQLEAAERQRFEDALRTGGAHYGKILYAHERRVI